MTGSGHTCRRTLSEIASTCQKAARASGCPWGLAEEAGMAARVLESVGLPGAECVAAILTSDRACPCVDAGAGPACGIATASKLSDRIHQIPAGGRIEFRDIVGPIILAGPLLLAARRTGAAYHLTIDGHALRIGSEGVEGDIRDFDLHEIAKSVSVATSAPPSKPTPATPSSREIPAETWKALETLAAKTLVPESELSRSSGAGPDE